MTEQMTTVSAYDILGIDRNAPQKDVHSALRRLALAWHPDRVPPYRRGEATLRFQSIMDAYNKLRTPEGRTAYDQAFAGIGKRKRLVVANAANSNDNVPLATKAKAWLKAIETVFWPLRKTR
jgi:DnaJ-class molecular chaperone